jgi:hypothetical protein
MVLPEAMRKLMVEALTVEILATVLMLNVLPTMVLPEKTRKLMEEALQIQTVLMNVPHNGTEKTRKLMFTSDTQGTTHNCAT